MSHNSSTQISRHQLYQDESNVKFCSNFMSYIVQLNSDTGLLGVSIRHHRLSSVLQDRHYFRCQRYTLCPVILSDQLEIRGSHHFLPWFGFTLKCSQNSKTVSLLLHWLISKGHNLGQTDGRDYRRMSTQKVLPSHLSAKDN